MSLLRLIFEATPYGLHTRLGQQFCLISVFRPVIFNGRGVIKTVAVAWCRSRKGLEPFFYKNASLLYNTKITAVKGLISIFAQTLFLEFEKSRQKIAIQN